MTKQLTISDVKKMLEIDNIGYTIIAYEYGFLLEYKNIYGTEVKYYFNQEGHYMYPTEENLNTLGKKI